MRLASGGRPVDVLTDVSLDVPAGQFLAVAGPSGSGKSTLLGLIAGLDQPTAGPHPVAGVDITRLDEDALARFRRDTIGYVFQSFHLIPTLTALENVAVPLELAGEADAARARARRSSPRWASPSARTTIPSSSPGGEQQRVAVARARSRAARAPARRRADGQSRLGHGQADHRAARRAQRDTSRSTLVLVTHDAALAARADRVVTLRDGRVVSDERRDGRPA